MSIRVSIYVCSIRKSKWLDFSPWLEYDSLSLSRLFSLACSFIHSLLKEKYLIFTLFTNYNFMHRSNIKCVYSTILAHFDFSICIDYYIKICITLFDHLCVHAYVMAWKTHSLFVSIVVVFVLHSFALQKMTLQAKTLMKKLLCLLIPHNDWNLNTNFFSWTFFILIWSYRTRTMLFKIFHNGFLFFLLNHIF